MLAAVSKIQGSAVLFAAALGEKVCYLAAMLVISRLLSVADFGKFSFALYAGFAVCFLATYAAKSSSGAWAMLRDLLRRRWLSK